jgi:hypothetical protein
VNQGGSVELAAIDVGLGTAYERVAIYRLLDRWAMGRKVRSAFEGPIDGMAGIPGLHFLGLARRGCQTTVALPEQSALDRVRAVYKQYGVERNLQTVIADPNSLPSATFDLVLTYNALPLCPNWRDYLERIAKLATRYLIVSVTNPFSYGVHIRKLMRLVEPKRTQELFDHESTRPAVLEPLLSHLGRTLEHDLLDCPWWPDLFVETGQTLASATIERLPGISWLKKSSNPGFLYGPESFPLFEDAHGWDELARALRRHPAFDEKGPLFGRLFGHHHAYLLERSAQARI